jgi:cobalt-zinc-cadmium efflux system outer membrane protein
VRHHGALLALLWGLGVLGPPTAADAEERGDGQLTVEELVARGLAENPELRSARSQIEAARGRLLQAGFRPNPMLDLSATRNVTGPDNMQMIALTWPLDLGGRKDARVSVAERELAVKQAEVAERERRLAAEVRMKAGEVLAAARNLAITDDLIAASRSMRELVARRVAEGATPALDEQLLLVEVTRLEAQRAGQTGRLESVRLQLLPLVGLGPPAALDVAGSIDRPLAVPERSAADARAIEQRADLRIARLEERLAEARVEKERVEGRYDASLFGQYQRQDTGFDLMGTDAAGRSRPIQDVFHMLTFGVSITLPVRHQNQGNVAAARAELDGTRHRRESMDLVVRQEVASAYTQLDAAERAEKIYATQVLVTARRNLDVVRQTYELGRVTLLDVVAEQRRLLELAMAYTDALKQRWDAAVEVQRALGMVR